MLETVYASLGDLKGFSNAIQNYTIIKGGYRGLESCCFLPLGLEACLWHCFEIKLLALLRMRDYSP